MSDVWSQKLTAMYQRYNPSEIGKVENLLKSGRTEEQVLPNLFTKYSIAPEEQTYWKSWTPGAPPLPAMSKPPTPSDTPPAPAATGDVWPQKLTAMYQRYNPSEIGKVENLLKSGRTEEQVLPNLFTKY
eukprot:PhF_6_TR31191/c0_g1_i4/m.45742